VWIAVIALVAYIVWSFLDPKEKSGNYPYKGMRLEKAEGTPTITGESIASAHAKLAGLYDAVDTLPYEGRTNGVFVFYNTRLLGARGLMVLITDSLSNVTQVRFNTSMVKGSAAFRSSPKPLRDLKPYAYKQEYSFEDLEALARRLSPTLGSITKWGDNATGGTREFRDSGKNRYLELDNGSLIFIETEDRAANHNLG